MSEMCEYCSVVSRSACSTYKRKYLEQELRTCPNLFDDQRAGALQQAGFHAIASEMDDAAELRRENDRLRHENDRLRGLRG